MFLQKGYYFDAFYHLKLFNILYAPPSQAAGSCKTVPGLATVDLTVTMASQDNRLGLFSKITNICFFLRG